MLKRLRNRLLLVNMIALSVVMIAAFAIVYTITYINAMDEIDQKVQRVPVFLSMGLDEGNASVSANANSATSDDTPPPDNTITDNTSTATPDQGINNLPVDFAPSFSIFLNSDGEMLNVYSHLDITWDSYYAAINNVKNVKSGSSGQIDFEGRRWQFAYVAQDPFEATTIFKLDASGNPFETMANNITRINFVDITETTNSLARLLITFIIAGAIMLVALFAVSFFFANRSIKPIEESWNKQRKFVADASHELKTPIAIISANMDVLESDPTASVESQGKWLGYARQELGRMGKLINDLLYLAQSEDIKIETYAFDLSKLARDVSTSMEAVLFEKHIHFSQSIEDNIIINSDAGKIEQAIKILLDNASKYTETDAWISLDLSREKGLAKLCVNNCGTTISPQDLTNIFDRFYRPDQSRSSESGGYGLGLSIFKTIIERSGGKVFAQSANNVNEFGFSLKCE